MTSPRVGWYGDDFTGASDTLAVFTQAGLRALLFLGVPSEQQQDEAQRVLGGPPDAVGIAGATRSMAPDAMRRELAPAGAFFARQQVRVLHYKVCSTFDSAPGTGSIGAAVATLRPHVENPMVAIAGGQPSLGRYCAFSNLFAASGRGGAVERIDRHPTMRQHPVTPMHEADLRRHLALQGLETMGALHYPVYDLREDEQDAALRAAADAASSAVLFDVAHANHLRPLGRLLWDSAQRQRLLAVGPSSVAQALVAHWGTDSQPHSAPRLAPASGPVFVLAGSLSPVTARQVRAARSYQPLTISSATLLDAQARARAVQAIGEALRAGRHVLAFSAPDDPAAADTRQARDVAAASARLLREVLEGAWRDGRPLRRVGVAGGDTSSLAVQALAPWALSCAATLGAGVTVSRAHATHPAVDGLELMLKGGQMGAESVFEELLAR
ncbi:MAG TPA: four-carbon acid sugar kinase family protein [Ramlibacter sp.]|uniref:four-carbon acid sugar kinase family protein n=1 Tax=Ramlibacter sp. TaxID=1917967 RepID=UPI002ED12406